jgi:hypothetical protein
MNRPHLSDDELIALLYGLGDAEGHLAQCPECGDRWNAMHRAMGMTRAESARILEIGGRRLAAQRQEILQRLENPRSGLRASSWIPAATVAALLAAAMFVQQHSKVPPAAPPAEAAVNAETDGELFTDVYSMEQDVEPRAAAPIRALFQEASFEEEYR